MKTGSFRDKLYTQIEIICFWKGVKMFQVGEKVVYGIHGVCNILGREESKEGGTDGDYLVLQPIDQENSRYLIPVGNPTAMGKIRKVLSRSEMDILLGSQSIRSGYFPEDESQRKQMYRNLIGCNNREKLLQMVYVLYKHRESLLKNGKRMHLCDENFLRDAEKLLLGEISYIMEITREEAKQHLRRMLKDNQ